MSDKEQELFELYYRGQGFAIMKSKLSYQIRWLVGAFGREAIYPISEELVQRAMQSNAEACAVMNYVETGNWPKKQTEAEKEQATKAFLRRHPELLIKIPDNQKKFDSKELKDLLSRGKRILEK